MQFRGQISLDVGMHVPWDFLLRRANAAQILIVLRYRAGMRVIRAGLLYLDEVFGSGYPCPWLWLKRPGSHWEIPITSHHVKCGAYMIIMCHASTLGDPLERPVGYLWAKSTTENCILRWTTQEAVFFWRWQWSIWTIPKLYFQAYLFHSAWCRKAGLTKSIGSTQRHAAQTYTQKLMDRQKWTVSKQETKVKGVILKCKGVQDLVWFVSPTHPWLDWNLLFLF